LWGGGGGERVRGGGGSLYGAVNGNIL